MKIAIVKFLTPHYMQKLLLFLLAPALLGSCSLVPQNTPQDIASFSVNTTTTESPQDAMMREHCKMMPEMHGCEKYKNTNTTQISSS
jgi:Tfp pilus assembly protein PilV